MQIKPERRNVHRKTEHCVQFQTKEKASTGRRTTGKQLNYIIDKVILFTIDIKSPVSKSMKLCTQEVVNQTASELVCYVRNLNCVVPENIYTPSPTEETFALDPRPGKNSYVKNAVALCYCAKDNCFCDKERKNPFIHVNTVSNNLNFAL